jgi:hypothetical protein
MGHEVEYDDSMMKMLELIWGDGFMAPGGSMSSFDWTKREDTISSDMAIVFEKGELTQTYCWARKPL